MKSHGHLRFCLLLALLLFLFACASGDDESIIGTGTPIENTGDETATDILFAGTAKADVTGTPALVVFMGMADPTQKGQGLLSRSYARAFVLKQGNKKIAYVTLDICMVFQGVKQTVVRTLEKEGWSYDNLMLQGTHTHATPGGTSLTLMYNMPENGFVKENFDVQVDGIVKAVRDAEASLKPVQLRINADDLFQCGWNRSPKAYNNNPKAEIEHYGRVSDKTEIDHEEGFSNIENLDPEDREHQANGLSTGYVGGVDWNNTNKQMILLKIADEAVFNWFALHPTTLGAKFRYISGDNKGYAESLWERRFPDMIGAFAQASCGDVSGNIKFGPPSKTGIYDWQNTRDLGRRQYQKAMELYNNANGRERLLSASIDCRHIFVNLSDVTSNDPKTFWKTSKAAMGGPFSAGSTEDSRSPLQLYREGITVNDLSAEGAANINERIIAFLMPDMLSFILPETQGALTKEYRSAQYPKAILIANGYMLLKAKDGDTGETVKTPISPEILPVQLFRIGELILCAMPVEVTTMAGRRIENTIKLIFNGDSNGDGWADEEGPIRYVVVAQCTNAYAGYVTTFEEYQKQYYEGASTQFGPHQLKAFQQVVADLARSMKSSTVLDKTSEPIPQYGSAYDLAASSMATKNWPLFDTQSAQIPFGGIIRGPYFEDDPDGTHYLKLKVLGAFPNRNLMTEKTYMTVKTPQNSTYVLAPKGFFYTDADPETRFHWEQGLLNQSYITMWFDMTGQPITGEYEFTYTSEARTISNRSMQIRKKYIFNIEDVGTENLKVEVADF